MAFSELGEKSAWKASSEDWEFHMYTCDGIVCSRSTSGRLIIALARMLGVGVGVLVLFREGVCLSS